MVYVYNGICGRDLCSCLGMVCLSIVASRGLNRLPVKCSMKIPDQSLSLFFCFRFVVVDVTVSQNIKHDSRGTASQKTKIEILLNKTSKLDELMIVAAVGADKGDNEEHIG
ncbi:hypothetical protein RYX36_005230 [Vicia faba]